MWGERLLDRVISRYNKVRARVRQTIYYNVVARLIHIIYDEYRIDALSGVVVNQGRDSYFYLPPSCDGECVVYSVGVGANINFGLIMLSELNAQVFAFDPTPQSKRVIECMSTPEQFHFRNVGVAASSESGRLHYLKEPSSEYLAGTVLDIRERSKGVGKLEFKSLKELQLLEGHERIDILKLDVEGAEYEILDSILEMEKKPDQIIVEFHPHIVNYSKGLGQWRLCGWKKTAGYIRKLMRADYYPCYRSKRGTEFLFVKRGLTGEL